VDFDVSKRILKGFLSSLDEYSEHTWVFFDTETTGLHPKSSQLTEIAAIAMRVSNETLVPVGRFHRKVKLTDSTLRMLHDPKSVERIQWERDNAQARTPFAAPQDVLSMTRYGQSSCKFYEEQETIVSFLRFLLEYDNPLLVAQNAAFDMRMLSVRSTHKVQRCPVLDTKVILQHYFLPLLHTLASVYNDVEASALLDALQVSRSDGALKHSTSLGIVASALKIDNSGWHSAMADVEMMLDVYLSVIRSISACSDIDISREYARSVITSRR
jgi:DNA polymerase III epsilon subunit-like protein